jgi:uncharacterized delta-60 repeat protein
MKTKPFYRRFAILQYFLLITIFGLISVNAAPGDLDPTFTGAAFGVNSPGASIAVIKKQPDGKFLVGGTFTEINGQVSAAIARINADGSIDNTFSSPEFGNGNGVGGTILAIGVQSNGKIVVGGNIYGVNNVFDKKLYRLNPDGSLDTTFQAPSFSGTSQEIVNDLEIQPDDKIVLGGEFDTQSGAAVNFARFNANGTLDASFANNSSVIINNIEIQSDGKILTAGNTVARRNTDGSIDSSFTSPTVVSNSVFALKILPDGKIVIGGLFSSVNGFAQGNIARLNTDGSLDINFNLNNSGANSFVNDILLAADGKLIISGNFSTFNTTARQKVARLNSDGTLDTSFQNNTTFSNLFAKDAEFFADGKILLGGGIQTGSSPQLQRLNTDGSPDTSLTYNVSLFGKVREIVQQPDGKIIIAGQFSAVNGVKRNSLARLNADGSLDTSFVPYFNNSTTQQIFNAIVLQPDGKIIVGGFFGSLFLGRLNSDGSQDSSFVAGFPNGTNVYDISLQSNGQIIVGGDLGTVSSLTRKVGRLNANGSFDSTFGSVQPNTTVYRVDAQPDGTVYIGGTFTQIGATIRGRIARLTSTGVVDTAFNPPGGANGDVYNTMVQADGKVIVSGVFTGLNGSLNQQRIGRLNTDGTLDTSFVQSANASVNALKIQPDGKILIGGAFSVIGSTSKIGLARLNSNGTLDNTFNPSAPGGVVDIQMQPDGKILIGGDFTRINGVIKLRIARLLNTSVPLRTLFDYDGDGKADVSVFRASENQWYILQSSNFQVVQKIFAVAGDIAAPADYDGDGKTDVAIFRPSSGDFWYLSSINNAQINVHWGASGDIPRPADFDGDGKADFIVYRPSNSVWYRFGSTGVTSILAFGIAEDKPLIGDFDGDGKADQAIFRPSTGDWWYASSVSGQFLATHWGATGDVPVPADYDGDGKTDFAIFRPSNGGWFISNSSNGSFTTTSFGLPTDKPVAADFDGDGKADIAVYRPSTGTWYLLQTTAGFGALQFGNATDLPTENSYIP